MRYPRAIPVLTMLLLVLGVAGCGGSPGNAAMARGQHGAQRRASARRPPATAEGVVVRPAVRYETIDGVQLRLDAYLPASGSSHPAIVFVHGGGFRSGTRAAFAPGEQQFAPAGRMLARRGYATFAVDYRLAPQFPFPASEQDLLQAVRWVRRNATRLGVDPKRLGLFGASAGGSLAALAATDARGPLDAGDRVEVAISWSGPMDLTSFYPAHPFVAEYLGCTPSACPARYRAASPVTHVNRGDPPMVLVNGTAELVPLDQARQMAARLRAAHVPHQLLAIPGDRHAGEYAPAAWPETLRVLRRYLGR